MQSLDIDGFDREVTELGLARAKCKNTEQRFTSLKRISRSTSMLGVLQCP
jgi:hypothetical protein